MRSQIIGVSLGIAGVLLWFAPLVRVELGAFVAYQDGSQIGGLAYLLLIAPIAYAGLSWRGDHLLRIIAAGTALAITGLFVAQAGASTAWGLVTLFVVSAIAVGVAVKDLRDERGGVQLGARAS